ncbi:uncharacterized protein [Haliotis asinina]|uniref:uncharacterized protein isoform X2 n=1 Tax=Haliotis asinina TaxID=109174 RepID=UPI0035322C64
MADLDLRHIQREALLLPIRCLPQSCRNFLSNVLDPESALGRSDYRTFGELFGLSHIQTQGCRARNRDRSITGILLTEFGHEPIWKLITILQKMEVAGVREILASWQEIRRNYETEQQMFAGSYTGGVQNTESHCSCMNCPAFPSHPSIRGYPYIPQQPQDEGCHRGQSCQSCMPHPQQAWQPQSPLKGLKSVEGQMVGQDSRMVEMHVPSPGSTRTYEMTQKGPDSMSERQFVANIDQDDPYGRGRRLGSLQRMISDEDNCSYGVGWGEVEPVNSGNRNNGVGDDDGPLNSDSGNGNMVKNNGVGDGTKVQNNRTGDGNGIQNNGPGDEDKTQNSGPGHGNMVQNNGPGDRTRVKNNGVGDETRFKNNGVGDETKVKNNGVDDETKVKNSGIGDDETKVKNSGVGDDETMVKDNEVDDGNDGRDTKALRNQHGYDSQQTFCLTKNGRGNSPTTMSELTLDDMSEFDNKDLLAPADWDSFSTSGRNFQDKVSNASIQSPMAPKITKSEHTSSAVQMANHNNNGKPFQLNPVASDKSASPESTSYSSTYLKSIPADGHAYSFPPYAYSEYGYPNNEAHPSHQTMQKGYMYHHNGPPQTNHRIPQPFLRTPQYIHGFPQILQGARQNFVGTPKVQCYSQTIQGANRNVQCCPQNFQGGHYQMASPDPHQYTTRRGPPLHAMGRGLVPGARNWQVPLTSEVTPAKKTIPVASDHDQYPQGVPAAAGRDPRGYPTNPSDRPPVTEDGIIFNERGQVKLRGQESREATEKRLSDSDVVKEVSPTSQHRRHGSDEGRAACGREAVNTERERSMCSLLEEMTPNRMLLLRRYPRYVMNCVNWE